MTEKAKTHDCIVLGTGGVGSAALYHLARRGARALGLDRFPPGHDRGSSHGDTRIIRQAYFEHSDYVPLLLRARELWRELEERSGRKLYHETGLIEIGPPDGEVVPGVLHAAREHGLEVEELTASEVERRFAGYRVPGGMSGVFERRAGYLLVEECVRTHIAEAERLGAESRSGVTVHGWSVGGDGIVVETDRGRFAAGRLIVTPGAWAPRLLADLGVSLEVLRKTLLWYATASPVYRAGSGAPCFLYELPAGIFYGFPDIPPHGLKVAEHTGGEAITDPLAVDRDLHREDREPVDAFLRAQLPDVTDRCQRHAVCLYTVTPDRRFVVDRHPDREQIVFAAGLSGHGFKFTATLGEVVTDLALEGRTERPVEFLSLERRRGADGKAPGGKPGR